MNRSIVLLVLLLLLTPGIAGCAKDPGEEQDPSGSPLPETGIVEGVVLDHADVAIPGAHVMLLSTERSVQTDENGSFLIPAVHPGPLVVVASKDGHSSQTLRGELPEGGRLDLTFRLVEAPSLEPYDRTLTFEGVLACGIGSGLDCGPAVEEEDLAQHRFEVEPGLRGIVHELTWQSPAEGLTQRLRLEAAAATAEACGESFVAETGGDVLRLTLQDGFPIAGGYQCARVWPADDPVVQQSYELHVTLFYHAPVPEGFTAL